MIDGLIDSISSISSLKYIIKHSDCLKIYYDILIYNSICIVFHYFIIFLCKLDANIQYLNWMFVVGWYIPQFLFSLIFHNFYNQSIINSLFNRSEKTKMKWSLKCAYSIYSLLILLFSNIILLFIPRYNIFFQVVHFIYNSLINSFYCYMPFWNKKKYTIDTQIYIFERNLFYYLGFGALFSILRMYLDFVGFYHIYSIIYPLLCVFPFIDNSSHHTCGYRIPTFFFFSKKLSNYIIFLIQSMSK